MTRALAGIAAGLFASTALAFADGIHTLAASDPAAVPLAGVAMTVSLVELAVLAWLARSMIRPRRERVAEPRAVSVLVAAWNEHDVIERTIAGLLQQARSLTELEIIVADDGSTDGTADRVERTFSGEPRVRVLRLPHAGKGAALEAARRLAAHPLIATVDADTTLEPDALAKLASALDDTAVVAAGGAVLIESPRGVLGRFQSLEYLRTTWTRTAWASVGMLEQIPGAFSIFRAAALAEAGGFPLDSLTEDYEVSYRLYDTAMRQGRVARIAFVPEARAFTAPPDGVLGFVRQRTRWFAGFLSTLFRFRHLVLERRAGRIGLVRLPLKVLDAVTPPLALVGLSLSLFTLVTTNALTATVSAGPGAPVLSALLLWPLAVRSASDVARHLCARSLVAARPPRSTLGLLLDLLVVFFDAPSYGVFRTLVVLRAYPFALGRVQHWERSRAPRDLEPVNELAPAE